MTLRIIHTEWATSIAKFYESTDRVHNLPSVKWLRVQGFPEFNNAIINIHILHADKPTLPLFLKRELLYPCKAGCYRIILRSRLVIKKTLLLINSSKNLYKLLARPRFLSLFH